MSETLVSWSPVVGMYPAGLTHADFKGSVDNEAAPDLYVGIFLGDPATIASYGMSAFSYPPKAPPEVRIPTLDWLRDHLGGAAELAAREYAGGASATSAVERRRVDAFMTAVDVRAQDELIVSDIDYAIGIVALFAPAMIDRAKAEYLLNLGGHDPAVYLTV